MFKRTITTPQFPFQEFGTERSPFDIGANREGFIPCQQHNFSTVYSWIYPQIYPHALLNPLADNLK